MISIIILVLNIILLVLVCRLNKCGKIVIVKQEHTYVPQPRTKTVRQKVEVPDEE